MSGDHLVAIGKITSAHGLKGTVRVTSYADDVRFFGTVARLYLRKEGRPMLLDIQAVHIRGRSLRMKFRGRDSIEQVQDLIGETLFTDTKDLPQLGPDEYYWYQLIGMEVRTEDGHRLGTLREIVPTGTNDVYVVVDGDEEFLVPALRKVIREVDLEARTMVIRPME